MNPETLRILDSISRERNIDREVLIQDLEQAMISAARKHFNSLDTEEFGCAVDRLNGRIALWRNLDDGGREPLDLAAMGRIPAQTAKQVMIQKFREGERQSLLEEFGKRQGELVTGTAHRADGGALIVQLDRTEAIMPRADQIPGEEFKPGDRVRCLIREVRDQSGGGGGQIKIIVSRSHPDFIRKLFEAEVPEVAERIIEIKAMSREPGFRTKLAVASVDSKVDAVGACVGVRGSRIKNIVDELGGEKIDIVRWNESSQVLIANALKPAEVEEVSLCFELSRATIIVREDQLSLAIGRRGQNVRLAARLTGWDVDILTPVEFAKGLEILEQTVKPIEGVTEEMLDRMGALGIISVFDARDVGVDVLEKSLEMSPELAERVVAECSSKAEVVAEQQKKDKAEFEARRSADAATAMSVLSGGTVEPDEKAESLADEILGGAFAPSATSAPGGAGVSAAADGPAGDAPPAEPARE